MKRFGAFLAVVLCLLGGSSARADDVSQAKAHFKAGTDAYRRADYPAAIREFEEAYLAKPSGVLRYNIAQAYEKLGNIPAALRNFHLYLHEVPAAEDRATVEAAIRNLELRLQERGVQQLVVFSEPDKAQVEIDGKVAGQTPLAVELPPGAHQVALAASGYGPATRQVLILADRSMELDVALPKQGVADLGADSKVAQPAPSHPRLYTWIAAGTAGAALVGAVALGAAAKSNANALSDPSKPHAHADNQGYYDSAHRDATASNVLYGVTGAAGAAAVALFFVEGHF